jgi:two-component system response regulator YesN
MKIQEAASVLGYGSGIAFTRFFKKIMGMTPQEYRDMKR